MKFPSRSDAKQILLFALAGPPIAALFWVFWITLTAEFPPHHTLVSWFGSWVFMSFTAYIWGLLPAVLTGAASAFLRKVEPGSSARARVIRLAMTVAVGTVASWMAPRIFPGGDTGFTLTALGAMSSLVCGGFVELKVWPGD